jgi:hypothetical protein
MHLPNSNGFYPQDELVFAGIINPGSHSIETPEKWFVGTSTQNSTQTLMSNDWIPDSSVISLQNSSALKFRCSNPNLPVIGNGSIVGLIACMDKPTGEIATSVPVKLVCLTNYDSYEIIQTPLMIEINPGGFLETFDWCFKDEGTIYVYHSKAYNSAVKQLTKLTRDLENLELWNLSYTVDVPAELNTSTEIYGILMDSDSLGPIIWTSNWKIFKYIDSREAWVRLLNFDTEEFKCTQILGHSLNGSLKDFAVILNQGYGLTSVAPVN